MNLIKYSVHTFSFPVIPTLYNLYDTETCGTESKTFQKN